MIHVLIVSSNLPKQASTDAEGCLKTFNTPMSTNQNFSSDRQFIRQSPERLAHNQEN